MEANKTGDVLRVLMLHGYAQSGPLFEIKTRILQQRLRNEIEATSGGRRTVEFHFPTAPFRVRPSDPCDTSREQFRQRETSPLDAFTWCQEFAFGTATLVDNCQAVHDLEKGLVAVAETIRQQGPFHGVIGFSSGAMIAALVVSLLETNRKLSFDHRGIAYPEAYCGVFSSSHCLDLRHPPLEFGICYSGFSLNDDLYTPFYAPRIATPILHVIGRWDPVVGDRQSLDLHERCDGASRLLWHPGSHFVPQSKRAVDETCSFILGVLTLNYRSRVVTLKAGK